MGLLLCFALFWSSCFACMFQLPGNFCFSVNKALLSYSLTSGSKVWFSSESSWLGGSSFDNATDVKERSGFDRLGSFVSFLFDFGRWKNEIRVYESFVVFAQQFPQEVTGLQRVFSPTPCGCELKKKTFEFLMGSIFFFQRHCSRVC
jgi:hypothetical protein